MSLVELGWKGNANARACHLAAKRWLELHTPGRCQVVNDAEWLTPGSPADRELLRVKAELLAAGLFMMA